MAHRGETEKAMAPHSSILAWKIPWTEEPGGLQFTGSHRVGHNWSDLAAVAAAEGKRASLITQLVNHLPAMQETRVQFLIQEDPLEKEMATHSSIVAWRIPWTEEPGGLQFTGSQRVRHDWVTLLTYLNLYPASCLSPDLSLLMKVTDILATETGVEVWSLQLSWRVSQEEI